MVEKVIVVGGSGFVGSAATDALTSRGVRVQPLAAPRLHTRERTVEGLVEAAHTHPVRAELVDALRGADVVVNAAGDPDASSLDEDGLVGANGLLPALVAAASEEVAVERLVHISSAVVQGDAAELDDTEVMGPFSAYSRSKVLGEEVLRLMAAPGRPRVVRYRPPSVHAPGRRVTRMIGRLASTPLALVAGRGDRPSPQALLANVADAIAFIATTDEQPPPVVIHPWEGVTCAELMVHLSGGRAPRRIPVGLARGLVAVAKRAGRVHRPTAANARRLELLMLGQGQATSWLELAGWHPPVGREGWRALGRGLRREDSW